ncbi:MAG: DEAD/DEAH box helicase [Thermodesulfovibrionales bacterium]
MSFEEFNLHPRIAAGVKSAGFETPTPIQCQAIPEALAGRDVLGLAQTGTGKTAAFVLPILQRLLDGPRGRVRALILTPTRELAEQTHDDIRTLGSKANIRSMTIYGGVGMNPQIKKLEAGVEIIVACPGRLLDHMGQGLVDLSTVEVLVLDEADRMLDMGFMPDVRRIIKKVPKERQTLLFSATMPEEILRLTRDMMKDPVTVQVDHSRPAKTVSHSLYLVEPHLKTTLLMALLKANEMDSVLVFTRTRERTRRVAHQLLRAGFNAAFIEGGMPQSKRQAALKGFRDGTYQILVATDIAARGIDVLSISHVINYDMPENADAYTHRIGRTGRAERTGRALSLVTQADAPFVRSFESEMGVELELCELEDFDYNAPPPPRHAGVPRGGNGRRPAQGHSASGGARKGSGGNRRRGDGHTGGNGSGNRRPRRRPRQAATA